MTVVVRLTGDRLVLRELRHDDLDGLHAILSDPAVTEHTLWGPNSVPETRAFLAAAVAQAEGPEPRRTGFHLAVCDRSTDELVGSATLDLENTDHARGVVSFVITPQMWGRGLAGEALGLLLDLGFGDLKLHRVAAYGHPEHEPCARVMDKAGMRLEGRLRDYRLVRGEWCDCLLYARLATD
jgi:[ribosomal protein S5]-alanine N-acetyltransferase